LEIAKGKLIERVEVINQVAFLLGAFRQRMLALPDAYARRLCGLEEPTQVRAILLEAVTDALIDLRNLPARLSANGASEYCEGAGLRSRRGLRSADRTEESREEHLAAERRRAKRRKVRAHKERVAIK
jgi:hypothetical protein